MSQNLATIQKHYTEEEYLAYERAAVNKHELIDGQIVAMAGASREHNLISLNIASELRFGLKGKGCETYTNDMRVLMKKGRYGYPDVVVVCGEPQFADDEFDVLLNPVVVVEILSKSTRFRDKPRNSKHTKRWRAFRNAFWSNRISCTLSITSSKLKGNGSSGFLKG